MHRWCSTPGAYVPLHLDTYGAAVRGEINWSALSRLITQGRSDGLFAGNQGHPGKRKLQVLEAMEQACPLGSAAPILSPRMSSGQTVQLARGRLHLTVGSTDHPAQRLLRLLCRDDVMRTAS